MSETQELRVGDKVVTVTKLTLRKTKSLGGELKKVFGKLDELSKSGETQSLSDVIVASAEYAEDFIPHVTNLTADEALDLDYDQLDIIFEMFKQKNKSFLSKLAFFGMDKLFEPVNTTQPEPSKKPALAAPSQPEKA